jgi:hypothetical protein
MSDCEHEEVDDGYCTECGAKIESDYQTYEKENPR